MKNNPRVEKESLLKLVDIEIDEIYRKNASYGWTVWALIAAIATCGWLALTEIEKAGFRSVNLFRIWITLSFTLTAVVSLFRILNTRRSSAKPIKFLPANAGHGVTRPRFLMALIMHVAVYLMISEVYSSDGRLFVTTAYWLTGFYVVMTGFGLLLSFLPIVIPKELFSDETILFPRQRSAFGLSIAFVLIMAVLSAFVATSAAYDAKVGGNLTASELRLAALVAAIFLLLGKLSALQLRTPLLSNLIEIRRSLLLDSISTSAARAELEIAVKGLRSTDVLAPIVSDALTHVQRCNAELGQATDKLEALRSIVSKLQHEEDFWTTSLSTITESIRHHLVVAAGIATKDFIGSTQRMRVSMMQMRAVSRAYSSHGREIQIQTYPQLEEIFGAMAEFATEYERLVKDVYDLLSESDNSSVANEIIDELNEIDGISFDRLTGLPIDSSRE